MTNLYNTLITTKTLLAAGAVAAAMFATAPAQAGRMDPGLQQAGSATIINVHSRHGHHRHGRYGMLSHHEIRFSLRNQGLHGISNIHYRPGRDVYVANGWMGRRYLKVRVDPYNGGIIGSRVLRVRHGHGRHHWRHDHGYRHNGFTLRGPHGTLRFRW